MALGNFKTTKEMVELSGDNILSVKRMLVKRTIIAITSGVIGFGIVGCGNSLDTDSSSGNTETSEDEYSITSSTDALSTLNVVLVNDGISDEQMEQAESSLEATGLEVEVRDINELNKEGTECFIALTTYTGDDYKVIGNYSSGNNHADLLAIGMKVSFGGDIQKGVVDTSVASQSFIPSDIENAVGDQIMPNVTIAVPEDASLVDYDDTSIINVSFSDKILEGLARYFDSLNYVDIHDGEFLLRPTASDYVDSLDSAVLKINDLDNSYEVQTGSILLNKGLPNSFDEDITVDIEKTISKGNALN